MAVGFVTICPAEGADKPADRSADLAERVHALIGELDAETLAARSAAEKALLELGPEILPHLPAPELLPNASVRESVRRLRVSLQRTSAERSVQASRVTLRGDVSLDAALRSIVEQTSNRMTWDDIPAAQRETRVSVAFDRTPFWDAIVELERIGGLRADGAASGGALDWKPVESGRKPGLSTIIGATRITSGGFTVRPLVGDDSQRIVRLPVELSFEPRLRPLFLHYASRDVAASGDDGSPLRSFTPDAAYELPVLQEGRSLRVTLDYRAPANAIPDSIALRGEVGVLIGAGTEPFAFTGLHEARRIARRKAGVTVTLLDASARIDDGKQRVKVGMSVNYDVGGPAFESHRTWIFYNDAFLEDAQGRRVPREAGFATRQQTDGGIVVEYEFAEVRGKLSEQKFVYTAPTLLIDLPLRFELKAPAATEASR